jgi:CheY-like chemotaxis protein
MSGADLVIHDSQYTPEEYPAKKNWGHSTYRYVLELAAAVGVRAVALTHHDPGHDDAFLADLEVRARAEAAERKPGMKVFVAWEGWDFNVEPVAEPHVVPAVAAAAPTGGGRVLLADDDDDLRILARTALVRDGFEVVEASDGAEALRLARDVRPDLVVLDLLMPELDGLEVLRLLRAEDGTRDTPVLLFTTLDNEGLIREGFNLGAADYLTKPFTMPQLTARVRTCLARAISHSHQE